MYCPNCSTQASSDQRYCRLCGMDLHAVSQLLVGQPAAPKTAEVFQPQRQSPGKPDKYMRLGLMSLMSSLIVGSLILVFAGGAKFYPALGALIPVVLGISGLLLFSGITLMIYSGFSREEPKSSNTSMPKLQTATETTAYQQPARLPDTSTSVTEHTTELLETSASNVPARDTAPQSMEVK